MTKQPVIFEIAVVYAKGGDLMGSQVIKCNVHSCKFNDKSRYCTLNDIVVGSTTGVAAHNKAETECVSFEAE